MSDMQSTERRILRTTPRPPASRNSRTALGSSQSHCDRKQRYATTTRFHSRASRSDVSDRARDRKDRDRFSLNICNRVCGSSSSSTGKGSTGGGGAPSAGTKNAPGSVLGSADTDGGVMERARAFAWGDPRRR